MQRRGLGGRLLMDEFGSEDAFLEMLREMAARQERREADRLLAQAETAGPTYNMPMPGEFHPAYERHRRWLLAWLNEWPGLVSPDLHDVAVPVLPKVQWANDDSPAVRDIQTVILTKRWACGPAPYVGRPFVYAWRVGVDKYGRMVAGDARIQYVDGGSS